MQKTLKTFRPCWALLLTSPTSTFPSASAPNTIRSSASTSSPPSKKSSAMLLLPNLLMLGQPLTCSLPTSLSAQKKLFMTRTLLQKAAGQAGVSSRLLKNPSRPTTLLPSSLFLSTTARCLKSRPASTFPFVCS